MSSKKVNTEKGKGVHRCPVETCGKTFRRPGELEDHGNVHKGVKPYACPKEGCTKTFHTRKQLYDHKSKVHKKKHVCGECGKSFPTPGELSDHMNIHMGVTPYECGVDGCKQTFSTKVQRLTHKRDHHSGTEYSCNRCSYTTPRKDKLTRHMKICYDKWNCKDCGEHIEDRQSLIQHMDEHHAEERPFKCEQCGWRFKTEKELKHHGDTHSETKNYSCPHCNKPYKSSSGLWYHLKKCKSKRDRDEKGKEEEEEEVDVEGGEKRIKIEPEQQEEEEEEEVDVKLEHPQQQEEEEEEEVDVKLEHPEQHDPHSLSQAEIDYILEDPVNRLYFDLPPDYDAFAENYKRRRRRH